MTTDFTEVTPLLAQAVVDMGLLHDIIHGGDTDTVVTDGGTVDSVAKAVAAISAFAAPVHDSFTGDGVETDWTLSSTPASTAALLVFVDDAPTRGFTLSGNTLTIDPAVGDTLVIETMDLSSSAAFDAGDLAAIAAIAANITTVAGISANVSTVAASDSDITTVAADLNGANTIGGAITAASNAATSETNAAASATAAATAETNAETAETAAEAAQAAAETAQGAAETAQTGAQAAQTAAETAETNAETAETNAASSATAAASSASSAASAVADAIIAAARAGFRNRFGMLPSAVLGFDLGEVSQIALTRATVGTRLAAGGGPETIAIDGVRLEHAQETGEPLGLLLEPSATNLVPSSEDLSTGWVVASNLTRTTGKTDPSGGTKAVRLACTASGTGDGTNYFRVFPSKGAATSAVAEWWVRRVTGTGQVRLQNTSGVANGLDITSLIDGKWRKFQQAGGVGASNIFCGVGVTVSGDEIDVAFPQLFADTDVASSYIPTTGTAATRSADLATVDLSAVPAFRPDGFSLIVEAEIRDTDGVLLSVGTGSTNEIALDMQAGDLHLTGADSLDLTAASGLTAGDRIVVALRVQDNDVAVSVGGAASVTDVAHSMNANADELQLGANIDGTDGLPCVIGQVAIFGPLPNATLEAMSNG